ncbi:MAG: hypothetical protein WCF30_01715 [Terracidiphilus sp.]
MVGSLFPASGSVAKIVAPIAGAVVIGVAGIGYAVHEHGDAQTMARENQQITSQLVATRIQLDTLAAKVDALNQASQANSGANIEAGPAQSSSADRATNADRAGRRTPARRGMARDSRFDKLQSRVDAQGKAIEQTQNELVSTQGDLVKTRTELSGSIAKTHDELVVLEKKGERSYFEFDLSKTKEFKREGPLSMSLRKANDKHGYADLALIVDDRNLQQKHVNLYQPAMFYEPDSQLPVEVVINDISKDHIHGYVSAPKYRPSELTAMASANPASGANQPADSGRGDNGVVGQPANADQTSQGAPNQGGQPELRQRLPLPGQGSSQE